MAQRLVEAVANSEWLEGAVLSGLNLKSAALGSARLPYADLRGADLNDAVLQSALLSHAHLDGAQLPDADLISAVLRKADLGGANLTDARLDGAVLDGASFVRANLSGARLDGASLLLAECYGIRLDERTEIAGVQWHGRGETELSALTKSWWLFPGEMELRRFQQASSICATISQHFRAKAEHSLADSFYFLQMTAEHLRALGSPTVSGKDPSTLRGRASIWLSRARHMPRIRWVSRWVFWGAHRQLWGYAIRPMRVLLALVAIWIAFAGAYLIVGISTQDAVGDSSSRLEIVAPRGDPSALAGSADLLLDDAGHALVLSAMNLSTLGSDQITYDSDVSEITAAIEAITGVILMSAFFASLVSKYVRHA